MSTSISRGAFLKSLAGLALAGIGGTELVKLLQKSRATFPCRLLGPSRELGHLLRHPDALADINKSIIRHQSKVDHKKVVIIGGGMAGLSAAWWLNKNKVDDFVLLELEKSVGGNAACGQNQYGSYPWGAHYVPIPNEETVYVRELFEELKIIQGYNAKGEAIYDELMLCHEPQERLYKDGSFHEGLVPKRGLQPNEATDIARFFKMVARFREAVGSDGKAAFAIPLDLSSADSAYRDLDKLSMSDWLKRNNFASEPLLWYVTYCCRDDYGATPDNISAWAGIHYFAGRRGTAANAEQNAVLTWPQGNGYLAAKLRDLVSKNICVNALVTAVKRDIQNPDLTNIIYIDAEGKANIISADHIIFAAPRFVARRVIDDSKIHLQNQPELEYAPWMVANITLKKAPYGKGSAIAWDNVSYYSDSLGYVVADHQEITTREKPLVITYYYPLSQNTPKQARQNLYTAQPEEWSKTIVADLGKMHADIASQIVSIDLWPWGHGMVRPDVGLIWGERRREMKAELGNIVFAHSDMSGMSNFEEAQYHGVEAAKSVLTKLAAG